MNIKRNEIIQWLTNESWFLEACYKIAPNKETAEELYQYAFLAILEKPNKQIEEIYEGGYIRFYVVRLLYNAIHGKCSPFAKHRIQESDEVEDRFSDEESIPYKEAQEIKYEAIERTLPKLHWYERKIFEIWMEGNSARAIHRQTKISINEILRVIKKVKQQIRDEYNS